MASFLKNSVNNSLLKRVALVTGGTGLLGSWLIRLLITHGYKRIFVLARSGNGRSAETRVYEALRYHTNSEVLRQALKKVYVINGDLCTLNLGLSPRTASALLKQVTDIFHTAALADLNASLDIIRGPNVIGTRHVFEFALSGACDRKSQLRIHHISTTAVAGTLEGWFAEDQFYCQQGFNNPYEQSKFEAEELAYVYRKEGLNIAIYRPGIITGDSRTGVTTNLGMIYQPLHFLALGLFQKLPANEICVHSLTPVDKVAEAICLLSGAEGPSNCTWNLVNPYCVKLGELINVACRVFRCSKPALIPLEFFPRKQLSPIQWRLIKPFIPYLNYRLRFKAEQTNRELATLGFQWPEMDRAMLIKLFKYCIRCGFIRRNF